MVEEVWFVLPFVAQVSEKRMVHQLSRLGAQQDVETAHRLIKLYEGEDYIRSMIFKSRFLRGILTVGWGAADITEATSKEI